MTLPPLVSLIIPTYNYGAYLPSTLKSCLQQTNASLEIIVVDDGSTDETPQILAKYKSINNIIYQRIANNGVANARNVGMQLARGKYLIFLDADDLLGDTLVASQINTLENNTQIDISVCQSVQISKENKIYLRAKRCSASPT